MKKLSPTQVKVLRATENNIVCSVLYDSWYLSTDFSNIRCATIDKLFSRGFIEIRKDSIDYPTRATIILAGREYLRKLESPDESIP